MWYVSRVHCFQQFITLAVDPPPTVRLLTPKAVPNGRQPTKSKGCAFLEFATKTALQQALKLHQSELDGRMINVELTAGGGGKSEGRIEKLKKRNKELHEQRVCTPHRLRAHAHLTHQPTSAETPREADKEAQGGWCGRCAGAETPAILSDLRCGANTAQKANVECSGAGRRRGKEDEEAGQANTTFAGHRRKCDSCRMMLGRSLFPAWAYGIISVTEYVQAGGKKGPCLSIYKSLLLKPRDRS